MKKVTCCVKLHLNIFGCGTNTANGWMMTLKDLITKQERDAFKKLKTGREHKFETDFWARRDPSPNSPTNEFKDFNEANYKYVKETLKQPVDSDVGMTYLLLGNPTKEKKKVIKLLKIGS